MCTPGSSAPRRIARHSRDRQNPSTNAAPTKMPHSSSRRETSLEIAKAIGLWPLRAPSRPPRTATQPSPHTTSRATWDSGISLAGDGKDLFLVGAQGAGASTNSGKKRLVVVTRVEIDTGRFVEATIDVGEGTPHLAFGADQLLYLATTKSGRIVYINPQDMPYLLDKKMGELNGKLLIDIEVTGISALSTTENAKVLFVSISGPSGILALDLISRRPIDYISLGTSKRTGFGLYPLKLFASDLFFKAEHNNSRTAIIIGDFGPISRMVLADLNEEFAAFEIIQTVDLSFAEVSSAFPLDTGGERRDEFPLLIASNTSQDTIVVGSRLSRDINVYRRGLRSLEFRGKRTASTEPIDLSVSSDGSAIAVLIDGGNQVATRFGRLFPWLPFDGAVTNNAGAEGSVAAWVSGWCGRWRKWSSDDSGSDLVSKD